MCVDRDIRHVFRVRVIESSLGSTGPLVIISYRTYP